MLKKILFSLGIGLLIINIYGLKAQTSKAHLTSKKPIVEMVYVPGDTYVMGENDTLKKAKPYEIEIMPFYISKYEITYEQFARVYNWGIKKGTLESNLALGVGDKSSRRLIYAFNEFGSILSPTFYRRVLQPDTSYTKIIVPKGKEDYPCVDISYDAMAIFCNLLSRMEGLDTCYYYSPLSCCYLHRALTNGYHLPSEAEWEFAARGGNKSKHYIYSGSNRPEEVAWFIKNSHGKSHKVGLKKANELGLYDMSGNVWEWCDNGFDNYPNFLHTGLFVLKGGGYKSSKNELFITRRKDSHCNFYSKEAGFRIVRSTPEAIKKEKNKRSRRRGRRRR